MSIEKILLELEAIHFSFDDPFTWASGIKSPIYCDNRKLISHPSSVRFITQEFAKLIKKNFPKTEALSGTATAGIPWSSTTAYELNLPNSYIRGGSSKGHGLKKQVEGDLKPGTKIVIIEDLISTGKSSLEAYQAAKDFGLEVLGVISLMTYNLQRSKSSFEDAKVPYQSLTTIEKVKAYALEHSLMDQSKAKKLDEFLAGLE